jgi:hypothetical protein
MSIKNCTGFDSVKAGSRPPAPRNFHQTKQASCYLYSRFHKTVALLFSSVTWNAVSARGATFPSCEGLQRESGDVAEIVVFRTN